MSQETAPHIAALDLDAERVGNILINLGVLSHALGHEHAVGSLRPYCNHPERLSAEAQFVYDIFCRRIPELIDRWYGGEAGFLDVHPAHVLATRFGARRDA